MSKTKEPVRRPSQIEFVVDALNRGKNVKEINLKMLSYYDNMNNCPIIYRVIRALNRANIKVATDHAELAKGKVLKGQNDLLRVAARIKGIIAEEKTAKKGKK